MARMDSLRGAVEAVSAAQPESASARAGEGAEDLVDARAVVRESRHGRLSRPPTEPVVKVSGHDPAQGPTEGPHGPFGWSAYIETPDGTTYYVTNLGSRTVKPGETVKAGTVIGTVGDYARYGTPSHVHVGVHR